jgi:hypothetical protein
MRAEYCRVNRSLFVAAWRTPTKMTTPPKEEAGAPRMPASPDVYLPVRAAGLVAAPAATTAAAVAAAAVATAAAAATTVVTGASLVDGKGAAVQVLAVQGADRGLGLGLVRHLDEAEAAGAAGVAVRRDAGAGDGAVSGERRFQGRLAGVKAEIANVNVQSVLVLH